MYRAGYPKNYAAALSVMASTLAIVIPPSVPMVIYAVSASESVGRLLAAGLIPGILVALGLMLVHYIMCQLRGWTFREPFAFRALVRTIGRGFAALLTPLVILGAIFSGAFTATEGASVAALYCILISSLLYKEMGLGAVWKCIKETTRDSGAILFMISAASLLSYILAADQVPQTLARWIVTYSPGRMATIAGIIVLLLIAGMLLDPASAIIILVPILVPVSKQIGFDPIHFGLVFVLTMAIGLVTPPVAPCLMATCQVTDTRMEEVFPESIAYIIGMIAVLCLLIAVPSLTLWFPNLVFGGK
jgi:C4-dicarboxylate transporter DctM subunit